MQLHAGGIRSSSLQSGQLQILKSAGNVTSLLHCSPLRTVLQTSFGILHWAPPDRLGETVTQYRVTFQRITPQPGKAEHRMAVRSPFILEGLDSASTYEVRTWTGVHLLSLLCAGIC